MKRRNFHLMAVLCAAGYAAAVWWVFTRSTPLITARPVTIRVAHWQIEKGPPDGFAAVIRRYEELNPRVKVEQVTVPSPVYRQWLRTNLTGGTATDIMEFGYWLGGMSDVPVRYFEPLTRVMNEPNPYNRGTALAPVPWRLTFTDGLYFMLSQSPEIGQIYGATLAQGSMRLYCNRELLERITGKPAVAPRTFADFRRLCREVADYSQRTGRVVHPLAGSYGNALWLIDFLMFGSVTGMNLSLDREGYLARTPGQAQADYLQGRWSYRRPELQAALTLVREMTQQMRPGFTQLGRDAALQEFMVGEALFIFTGSWDATSLKRLATFPVAVMRFPQPAKDDPVVGPYLQGPFQDGMVGTSMEMYLNKGSRHKEEALDFMRFMTSVEGGQLFMEHSGWLSSVRGVRVPPEMEIFRPRSDGCTAGLQYTGVGSSSTMAFWQNLNLLVSAQGGVDQFVEAMESGLPKLVTEDLRQEVRTGVETSRAIDPELMALGALGRLQPPDTDRAQRQQILASNQTLSEINGYEAAWVLARRGVGQPTP